jgi:DNA repair protein RadA/Sms
MAKKGSIKYVCSNCGAIHTAWMGRCSNCGEWNTLTEQLDASAALTHSSRKLSTQAVTEVSKTDTLRRILTNMPDIDTILGGGLVPGGVVLIAGQPGIGKSTLLLQVAAAVSAHEPVLYVSGEESAHQIGLRATRLGLEYPQLQLATATVANDIAATIMDGEYKLVIVDSIQTIAVSEVASAAGTVSQITNSTQLLMAAAKRSNTALIVVGHVTKEGSIAGPKVLEHVVDVVR